MPPHATKRRTNNKFKNKNPELTENQTLWKSNNQRVKEETVIQASRRGRDGQPGIEDLTARQHLAEQAVPHLHVDKPERTTGSETDCATQGSSIGKCSLKTSD